MDPEDSQSHGPARWALPVAVFALLVWPLSFVWIPAPGRDRESVYYGVLILEVCVVVLALVAVWLGTLAARADRNTTSSDRAIRLGVIVVALVIGGNLFRQAVFR